MSQPQDTCQHVSSAREPRPTDALHKEECTQCFDDDKSETGLNVCLTCFNGGCSGQRKHSQRHYEITKHAIVANIRKTEIVEEEESTEPAPKITKLALGGEGGIPLDNAPKYEAKVKVQCLACNVEIKAENPALTKIIERLLKADSASAPMEQSLEEKREPCKHIDGLKQLPDAPQIAPKAKSHCASCDKSEDLWLCMTCGALGCPRSIHEALGGGGGNNHAIEHSEKTGHPVVLKTGTITPEGNADVFCYVCEKMVIDPHLAKHCAHFGLKLEEQEKTSKTLAEQDLDLNFNFNWNKVMEGDKEATLLYGAGKTGLANLGNSCYMSSIIQVLFSLPAFQRRYYAEGIVHLSECRNGRPATCFHCQMGKLGEGLWSGRYAPAPSPEELELHLREVLSKQKEEKKKTDTESDVKSTEKGKKKKLKPLQPGISPLMFRKLLTDGTQFANKKQQDALEFAHFFFDQVKLKELKGVDPTDAFKFQLEDRLQCLECKGVRYKSVKTTELSLAIPLETKSESKEKDEKEKEKKEKEKKEKESTGSSTKDKKEEEEHPPVDFNKILEKFRAPSVVADWSCPQCKKKTSAQQQNRLETLPDVLMVHLQRFVCPDWQPIKLDLDVVVEPEYDLKNFIGQGIQKDEKELPGGSSSSSGGSDVLKADQNMVVQLTSMGFSVPRSTRACLAVKNSGVSEASNWLFGNMENADLDAPLTPEELGEKPKKTAGSSGDDVPNDLVTQIESMGFEPQRAKYALKQTKNNVDRAIDWLMSHMDDPLPDDTPAPATSSDSKKVDTGSTNYRLVAVVTHRGKSTASGHYVAHLLKEGKWVLFNDSKVSLAEDPKAIRKGYLYFFRRVGK